MLDKSAQQYQTPDMIPVIQERVIDAINASKTAHDYLINSLQNMPYDLWDDEQCLKDHQIQIEQLLLLKEQCEFWRKNSYLTPTQKDALLELESSLTDCEKISQHNIFSLQEKLGLLSI